MWACGHFREYIIGTPTIIYVETDHRALVWLSKTTDPLLARWALKLSEYSLEIKYRPGRKNMNADALSRLPVNDAGPIMIDEVVYLAHTKDPNKWKRVQLK